jgi:tetratricopeptide (TPR) repeat protein
LHLEDDSGPGLGVLHAWTAHIYYQTGQYPQALSALHESIAALESEPLYADARSGLSADNVMIGNTLLKLGRFSDARAAYQKAEAGVNLDGAVASGDIPALYAVADAQSGMGDLTSTEALGLRQPFRQEQLAVACTFYAQSEQTWARILEPGLFNPSQFPSGGPQRVHARTLACRTGQPLPSRANVPSTN